MSRINLRQAVQSVKNYINEFNDILGNNLNDLRIEETELSEDEKFWLITIGFNREIGNKKEKEYVNNPLSSKEITNSLPKIKSFNLEERVYKIFKVDSSTGEVVSMKMYKL